MSSDWRILGVSKITRGYQVTVTKQVRDKLNFEFGDLLLFLEEGDRVYIEKS